LIDPICEMTVEPTSAAAWFDYDGTTYYFCSVHCQKLFQTDPAKYLAAAKSRYSSQLSAPSAHQIHPHHPNSRPDIPGVIYTCPMDPEVRQQGPGACPKCGMALEPLDIGAALTKTEYT
jgi:Cu+-exporting ATPase